jgi:hypothetical protein
VFKEGRSERERKQLSRLREAIKRKTGARRYVPVPLNDSDLAELSNRSGYTVDELLAMSDPDLGLVYRDEKVLPFSDEPL